MLGSLRLVRLFLPTLLLGFNAFAISPAQCKAGCKSEVKPKCEKACRDNAKKYVDQCLKEMCEIAMKRCDEMCEKPLPPPKKN